MTAVGVSEFAERVEYEETDAWISIRGVIPVTGCRGLTAGGREMH